MWKRNKKLDWNSKATRRVEVNENENDVFRYI